MNLAAAKKILSLKNPARLYDVVEPTLADADVRSMLVAGSFDKNENFRYNCARVLFRALGQSPQPFYPYWDRFAEMIDSPNGFHRSVAAQAIAFLSQVDADCRLDAVLNHYLGLLDDSKVMVSHYFIETLDVICRARPEFQKKIVTTLLSIDGTSHQVARRELLKADILAVFDRLFDRLSSKDKKQAISFAEASLESESAKTRKAAKSFLAKYPR